MLALIALAAAESEAPPLEDRGSSPSSEEAPPAPSEAPLEDRLGAGPFLLDAAPAVTAPPPEPSEAPSAAPVEPPPPARAAPADSQAQWELGRADGEAAAAEREQIGWAAVSCLSSTAVPVVGCVATLGVASLLHVPPPREVEGTPNYQQGWEEAYDDHVRLSRVGYAAVGGLGGSLLGLFLYANLL